MRNILIALSVCFPLAALPGLAAEETCQVVSPTAGLSIPHRQKAPDLNTDSSSPLWQAAVSAWIVRDCTITRDYPRLKSEVRAFWTDADLY